MTQQWWKSIDRRLIYSCQLSSNCITSSFFHDIWCFLRVLFSTLNEVHWIGILFAISWYIIYCFCSRWSWFPFYFYLCGFVIEGAKSKIPILGSEDRINRSDVFISCDSNCGITLSSAVLSRQSGFLPHFRAYDLSKSIRRNFYHALLHIHLSGRIYFELNWLIYERKVIICRVLIICGVLINGWLVPCCITVC